MLLGAQNADAFLSLPGYPMGDRGWVNLLDANKLREFICIIVFTTPQGNGKYTLSKNHRRKSEELEMSVSLLFFS